MRRLALLGLLLISLVVYSFFNINSLAAPVSLHDVGSLSPRGSGTESGLTENKPKPAQIYFLGDVMLARDVERRILQSGNDFPFAKISFAENSYVISNFESAVPQLHVPTPNNTFRFSTREDFLPILSKLGLTHASLANNHAYDHGLSGYNDTIDALWDAAIVPFGHPTQLASTSVQYLVTASGTVSVLALHTLFSAPDQIKLAGLLDEMREFSDWQVVYIHWGEEYVSNPNLAQRKLAKQLVAYGADLIIGHHPHVVQSIERVDGVLVLYSLGNFIFDQYFSTEVQQGLVARLNFSAGPKVELLPVSSLNDRIQPQFMDELTKLAFLTKLASTSDPTLSEAITAGVLQL